MMFWSVGCLGCGFVVNQSAVYAIWDLTCGSLGSMGSGFRDEVHFTGCLIIADVKVRVLN